MSDGKSVLDVYDSFTEDQAEIVECAINAAIEAGETGTLIKVKLPKEFDSFTEDQRIVVEFLISSALKDEDGKRRRVSKKRRPETQAERRRNGL